jgi:hypothetical protein
MILWLDLETWSKCDIKKCGGYRYAEDPSTEITLFGYAVGNSPAKVWDLTTGDEMPEDLREAVNNPETVFIAHNSMFDRNVLKHKLGAPFGDPKRWKDTMILAYSVGLPGALGLLSEVLGLPQDKAKDKDGHRLVLKFCKPTATGKRWTRENAPEDWSRFVNYCRLDVEAMREMTKRIYAWNSTPQMWADWHCDQIINDRGIKIDMELVAGALKCADEVKAEGDAAMSEATDGDVQTAMQRDELLKHILFMYGVSLPNLQKATLEKRLNDENLPEPVRELIALRLSSAVASVAKYKALGRAAGKDGRIRGSTQFMGASRTGRFCLTGDHEVLTEEGWVRLDEWGGGKIFVFDPVSRAAALSHSHAVSFPCCDALVVTQDKRIDQAATEEHAMPVVRGGAVVRESMATVSSRRSTVPISAVRIQNAERTVADAKVRVLVMTQADGHYAKSGALTYHFKKTRKIERCRLLLDAAGILYTEAVYGDTTLITIARARVPNWLASFDKVFHLRAVLRWNADVFFDELKRWDSYEATQSSFQYSSKVKENADTVQALAHLTGRAARVLERTPKKAGWSLIYCVNVWTNSRGVHDIRVESHKRVPFHGTVYCAMTPTGFFFVRRNGSVWVTGNSGRLVQFQNLPRGTMKPAQVEEAIDAIKSDLVPVLYDDPNRALSNCIRGCVVASEGHKLAVADLSNIEGRVLAWLAGEKWKIEAFKAFDRGEGPDLYRATYARTFGIKADEVTKHQRQIGKVLEIGLGYQGGVGAFLTFAPAYGVNLDELAAHVYEAIDHAFWVKSSDAYDWALSKKLTHGLKKNTWIACDAIKNAWRAAHPATVAFWRAASDAMVGALTTGNPCRAGDRITVYRPAKGWLAARLPSGRGVCYPSCRLPQDGERCDLTFTGVDQYTRKWQRVKTYGGKLCISEQTPVLCRRGWIPIEGVTSEDEVWDGEEWVSQGGAVMQGVKPVIRAHGVYMTPDHLVLTTEGWKDASSSERYDRLPCRIPDGYSVRRLGREEFAVAGPMRLRGDEDNSGLGARKDEEARGCGLVRMQEGGDHIVESENARDVETSGVGRLAQYETEVRMPDAQGVEELRRTGDNGVSRVERVVRGVLEGHGPYVQVRSGHRSDRQQRGVLEGELSVGHAKGERQQQKENGVRRRETAHVLGGENRDWQDHAAVSPCAQLSERAAVREAGCEKPVYDLLNCGPRHRFVVLGEEGPLIVHNCENIVQATARDILMAGLRHAEDAGMRPVMHIHDEIVCEVPDYLGLDDKDLARMMTTDIPWAEGLPLAAAGFTAHRYRKD